MIQLDERTERAYQTCQRIRAGKKQGLSFEEVFPDDSAQAVESAQLAIGLYAPLRQVWDLINVKAR